MMGSSASGVDPSITWHHTMELEDRHNVRRHIEKKVEAYFAASKRTITEDELKDRAARFETIVFEKSKSRKEYLHKIAKGLTGIETRTKDMSRRNSRAGPGDTDQSAGLTVASGPESAATDVGSTSETQISSLQDKISHLSLLTGERSAEGDGSEEASGHAPTEGSSG